MNDTMKALAKTKPGVGLELIDAPIPVAGPEDVLIRVHRTAVCGTDIHIWNWDEWSQKNVPVPMITGHEFAGEIVAIGKDVDRRLSVGQRVSAEGHVIDLNSEAARAGHFHLDPATKGIGVNRQGAFAEFVVAPAFNVIELPDDVPYEIGAILDPFGNAVHTAQQFDLLGEDVLVTGAGPIGMMAAAVARHAGARTVVLTDINDFRLCGREAKPASRKTADREGDEAKLEPGVAFVCKATWLAHGVHYRNGLAGMERVSKL